jgi:hypothetical protein
LAKDQARRDKARVPQTIAFQTKPEIAFEQIKAARAAGLPKGVVLMDAGYGNDTGLRTDITAAGSVPTPRCGRRAKLPCRRRGEPIVDDRRHGSSADSTQPISVKTLTLSLPQEAWQSLRGARAVPTGSFRASRGVGYGPLIATPC